jgi:hypothetical protein
MTTLEIYLRLGRVWVEGQAYVTHDLDDGTIVQIGTLGDEVNTNAYLNSAHYLGV